MVPMFASSYLSGIEGNQQAAQRASGQLANAISGVALSPPTTFQSGPYQYGQSSQAFAPGSQQGGGGGGQPNPQPSTSKGAAWDPYNPIMTMGGTGSPTSPAPSYGTGAPATTKAAAGASPNDDTPAPSIPGQPTSYYGGNGYTGYSGGNTGGFG
jgi:hypothetical protein